MRKIDWLNFIEEDMRGLNPYIRIALGDGVQYLFRLVLKFYNFKRHFNIMVKRLSRGSDA